MHRDLTGLRLNPSFGTNSTPSTTPHNTQSNLINKLYGQRLRNKFAKRLIPSQILTTACNAAYNAGRQRQRVVGLRAGVANRMNDIDFSNLDRISSSERELPQNTVSFLRESTPLAGAGLHVQVVQSLEQQANAVFAVIKRR
jgi:hypothetical protein